MTKKIEKASVAFAVVLSILLVAQTKDQTEKHHARQINEIEFAEKLHSANVDFILKQEPLDIPVTESDAKAAEELALNERFNFAQKCFKNWECYKLAEAVYFEDRGGGLVGMKAVANVVVNRTKTDGYPNTISGVVNQKRRNDRGVMVCQFSYMCQLKDRTMKDKDARILAGYVAWKAFGGISKDITNGATHYYNPAKVSKTPKFAREYTQVAAISDHLFYRSM